MLDNNLKKWHTNHSKYLVDDRWLKLRADSCTTPEGHIIEPFYVFEYRDWVNCFVIDDNLNIIMVNHYRHGVDRYVLELVSGGLEETDSSPKEGMKRELTEEIGYIGGEIYQTGISYPNASSQTNKVYSFIAIGGNCKLDQNLERGENLQITPIALKDFIKTIEAKNTEVIYQSTHLATIFFALHFIKVSQLPAMQKLKGLVV